MIATLVSVISHETCLFAFMGCALLGFSSFGVVYLLVPTIPHHPFCGVLPEPQGEGPSVDPQPGISLHLVFDCGYLHPFPSATGGNLSDCDCSFIFSILYFLLDLIQ